MTKTEFIVHFLLFFACPIFINTFSHPCWNPRAILSATLLSPPTSSQFTQSWGSKWERLPHTLLPWPLPEFRLSPAHFWTGRKSPDRDSTFLPLSAHLYAATGAAFLRTMPHPGAPWVKTKLPTVILPLVWGCVICTKSPSTVLACFLTQRDKPRINHSWCRKVSPK